MEELKRNKAQNFAYINLAILLMMSLKPWPRWFMSSGTYQIIFILTTTLSLIALNPVIEKISFKIRMLILIILYAVFFYLPVFHELRAGYFFDSLIFLELLLLPVSVFSQAYVVLKNTFYWISVFAILIWLINLAGIELPNYSIYRGVLNGNTSSVFTGDMSQIYHIYGPVVSLYIKGGVIERATGIFIEPGHFGIYLGLMMAINKFCFNDKKDVVMLIAGVLTFSTAFYGILGLGLIYKFFLNKESKKNSRKLLAVCFLATLVLISSNTIQQVVIGRVIGGRQMSSISDLVENRVMNSTKIHYEKLLKSDRIWLGVGLTETDKVQETNWRGGVYRYGIIGIAVFILLILNIISIVPLKYKFLLLSITALVMSHRIYQLFYTGLPYLIYMASLLNSGCEENVYSEGENSF